MSQPLRIAFAGTPEFAATSLQALLDSAHTVCGVFTQPDRPAGRGRKLHPSAVKTLAQAHDLPVFQPPHLRSEAEIAPLRELQPDLFVVAAYGLLLPLEVLLLPRWGCLNVHASLLPRWRGAAPIQRAIAAGDDETGITLMQMDEGLDTGDMLYQARCEILPTDTGSSLHDRLADLGADTLAGFLASQPPDDWLAIPQDSSAATYAAMLSKQESEIDWQLPATTLARQVRAFNSWPVAYTFWGDQRLRIWQATARAAAAGIPGTVSAASPQGIDVVTGDGLLRIGELQLPGARRVSAADFINAHDLTGTCLGKPASPA